MTTTNKLEGVHLVGICGPARAGKDTLAHLMTQCLQDATNEDFANWVIAQESFAAPIKSMIAMLLDFSGYGSVMNPESLAPYIDGDLKEEELDKIGKSPRQLMQTLGTEWGRGLVNENIWIDNMEGRIGNYQEAKKHGYQGAFVFITDVRFDNEAEMIKNNGGTIVRVTTDRETDDVTSHASESGVSECMVDSLIENNGDMDEYKRQALSYLEGVINAKLDVDGTLEGEVIKVPTVEEATG